MRCVAGRGEGVCAVTQCVSTETPSERHHSSVAVQLVINVFLNYAMGVFSPPLYQATFVICLGLLCGPVLPMSHDFMGLFF